MVARFLETAPLDCAAEIDVDRVDLLDEDVEDEDVELLEEDDFDELAKDEDALDEAEAEDTDTEAGRAVVSVVCMHRSTELGAATPHPYMLYPALSSRSLCRTLVLHWFPTVLEQVSSYVQIETG